MGVNFTSLFAYYLASPINWLIALLPQKYMIEIMNMLIVMKLCASSVTFSYYISKHFHTKKCTIALFGMFYALSAYSAAYSWNIMWLDCIVLIPLIMLGLEKLVDENKCYLYCISLGLCIFTNYYISIMVCISVCLYFIVLMIAYDGDKSFGIYIKKILEAMPQSKKELFFPIIVLPDKKIISYRCCLDGSNLVVAEDPVMCVADFEK